MEAILFLVFAISAITTMTFFVTWLEREQERDQVVDLNSPVVRYLAGRIGIAELEARVGAALGVESDAKLVAELDGTTDQQSARSYSEIGEPIDAIVSGRQVRIVMAKGVMAKGGAKTGTLVLLEELDRTSLEKVAGWMEVPVSGLSSTELRSKVAASFGHWSLPLNPPRRSI